MSFSPNSPDNLKKAAKYIDTLRGESLEERLDKEVRVAHGSKNDADWIRYKQSSDYQETILPKIQEIAGNVAKIKGNNLESGKQVYGALDPTGLDQTQEPLEYLAMALKKMRAEVARELKPLGDVTVPVNKPDLEATVKNKPS
jgi:hypothetical protein